MADDQPDHPAEDLAEPDRDIRASQPGIEAPLSQHGRKQSQAQDDDVASANTGSPSAPAAAAPAGVGAMGPADPPSPSASESATGTTTGDEPTGVVRYQASLVFLSVVTALNLVADLWSKHWAKTHFESIRAGDSRRVVLFEDVLNGGMNFIFAKNKGGAWGLLQNETESLRRPFFLIVSVAAIVFIVSLYRKLTPEQRALKWGLPLVLGGALGNLVDRIRYGYVVDFIDVYWNGANGVKHWPTFNVADIAICVGVGLMAIDMFTSRERRPKNSAAAKPLEPAAGSEAEPPPTSSTATAPDAPRAELPNLDGASDEQAGKAPSAPPLGG